MDNKLLKLSGALLIAFAALKIFSAFSAARILEQPAALFPFMTNRLFLLAIGSVEVILGWSIWQQSRRMISSITLIMLCLAFIIYHLLLRFFAADQPCQCLGAATDWLGLKKDEANLIIYGAILFFLQAGLISLFSQWRVRYISFANAINCKNKTTCTLIVFAIFLPFSVRTGSCANDAIVLEGKYDSFTDLKSLHSYQFKAHLKNCQWIIKYVNMSGSTNNTLPSLEGSAAYDGTNIYVIELQNDIAARQAWGEKYDDLEHKLPKSLATVYTGDYPTPEIQIVHNLWFALASDCYFDKPQGLAKPPSITDLSIFYSTNYACKYKIIQRSANNMTRKEMFFICFFAVSSG